jgi:hypothetical protein
MARDYIASLPPGLFPAMTGLADEFASADPDERFELLIDTFVDGLARRAVTGTGPLPIPNERAGSHLSRATVPLGPACHNEPMPDKDGSRRSIGSAGSADSIGSSGSVQSIGSSGSILSIGSTGSILSIGSAGSVLSVGSAGSVLSIGSVFSVASVLSAGSAGSVGSVLSALSRWSALAWRSSAAVRKPWRRGLPK